MRQAVIEYRGSRASGATFHISSASEYKRFDFPDMADMIQFVVQHGYILVFFWVLAEQAGLPLPAAPLLLAAGALAGQHQAQFRNGCDHGSDRVAGQRYVLVFLRKAKGGGGTRLAVQDRPGA